MTAADLDAMVDAIRRLLLVALFTTVATVDLLLDDVGLGPRAILAAFGLAF